MYSLAQHLVDHSILGVTSGSSGLTGSGTDGRLAIWSSGALANSSIAELGGSGFVATFDTSGLTDNRSFTLPDSTDALATSSSVTTAIAALGLTNSDPVLEYQATIAASAGFRAFTQGGSYNFDFLQSNITGLVLATATGSGARWKFAGPATSALLEVAGDCKATTFNRVILTESIGSTITLAAGKTFTVNETLTLTGTDGTTHTFPATTSSVARIDAAQTFSGVQTFSAQDVHTLGVDLSTSGRVNSQVADAAVAVSILLQPNVALTSGTDRWTHAMKDSAGNTRFSIAANGGISLFSEGATLNGAVSVAGSLPTSMTYGIFFTPTFTGAGTTISSTIASAVASSLFLTIDSSGATHTAAIGGLFGNQSVYAQRAHTGGTFIGGLFQPIYSWSTAASSSTAHGSAYGVYVKAVPTSKNATMTSVYGGYIEAMLAGATPATTDVYGLFVAEQTQATNKYGIWLANATAGYKAIAIRDANAWIGSAAAGEITIGGTNFRCASTNQGVFGVAAIARPTNAIAAAAFVANTSGIANDTATWGGYTMGQVVQALQNYGVLT